MEFILLVGAVAVASWGALVFVRGGLVGGMLLVLLSGACFGHAFFNVPVGPLPVTLDRALLGMVLLQYLVYRSWDLTDPKPLIATDYLLAAFLAALAASTVSHDFRYHNFAPLAQLLFFYLLPAALYWVARQTAWTERSALWLFSSLAVFGIYLCLTAVAETRQYWTFVFPKYIISPKYIEFFGRGRGPFLNPAVNGIVMTLGLCAGLLWWPRLNRRLKLVLLGIVPIFALGVYCTMTRSAWMGLGLALFVMIALTTPRAWRLPVLGTTVVAAILLVVIGWSNFVAFKRDRGLMPKRRPNRPSCGPFWRSSPGTCSSIAPWWAAALGITFRRSSRTWQIAAPIIRCRRCGRSCSTTCSWRF